MTLPASASVSGMNANGVNRTRRVEKYNFGCFGCWVMDEQGNLDYVEEKEYSEEMWEEMKKNGAGKLK